MREQSPQSFPFVLGESPEGRSPFGKEKERKKSQSPFPGLQCEGAHTMTIRLADSPAFQAWADALVAGYQAGQQWRHRLTHCPVALQGGENTVCHLCRAWAIAQTHQQEKEAL